jgi:RNA 3'-terminal phosphate cyclase
LNYKEQVVFDCNIVYYINIFLKGDVSIMSTITDIEGIGEVYAVKLRAAGVRTTDALLERGRTPKGRGELATMTGFSEQTILEWVNRADMFRIRGIGSQYSDLLETAGVDTVRELAMRKAETLMETLAKATEKNNNKLPVKPERIGFKSQRLFPRGWNTKSGVCSIRILQRTK